MTSCQSSDRNDKLNDHCLSSSANHNFHTEVYEKGHYARKLTVEEVYKLSKDTNVVNDFKQKKLEKEAKKNWDLFYKRNETRFFKDRHWTTREFEELTSDYHIRNKIQDNQEKKLILLEVGCGVGNLIFPLIEEKTNVFIYACDFSPRAVQYLKDHHSYDDTKCFAFLCDLTQDNLAATIIPGSVDFVSMVFVLSAIHPEKMKAVLTNVHQVLKPGGLVLFRDYGLYDQAMLRFSSGHKLSENFYVRQDGTRAFYFSEEYLSRLFKNAGYEVVTNKYVTRETVNKKEGICVPRIFIQGKFCKLLS
ncbi:tRNA N(3)-cytidine methyltransferase METTL6 isoform X1 [Tachypleus tridentatus]|uniref:tRNA N(3)-cytidine methyltransferase METTL6 isoform X1 n=1 Tax=Tachypleus tridentatus TaxID=6853 RepID=UPI003FD3EE96